MDGETLRALCDRPISPQTTRGELGTDEKMLADIPKNLVRRSAGFSSPADLIDDLEQTFHAVFTNERKPRKRKTIMKKGKTDFTSGRGIGAGSLIISQRRVRKKQE